MAKAYTIDDFIKLNPGYKKAWDPNTNMATLTNTANNKSINFGLNQGQQYGIGSSENETGSHDITDVNKLIGSLGGGSQPVEQATANKDLSGINNINLNPPIPAPVYKSPYEDKINSALEKYLNPAQFSYSPTTDPAYQAYQQQYTKAGEEAFHNTIGDLTSMTGGRLNTWAASAASQAKNKYMQDLSNIIPTLEQNAYNKQQNEYARLADQLKTLQELDTARTTKDKQNFIDTIGQYSGDFQQRINELSNDNDPSNDWQIPYLKTDRQDKVLKKEAAEKKEFLDTIGQFYGNYQAEIDELTNDGDSSNDWKIPHLTSSREEKLFAQAEQKRKDEDTNYQRQIDSQKLSNDTRYTDAQIANMAADNQRMANSGGGGSSSGSGSGSVKTTSEDRGLLIQGMQSSGNPMAWLEQNADWLGGEDYDFLYDYAKNTGVDTSKVFDSASNEQKNYYKSLADIYSGGGSSGMYLDNPQAALQQLQMQPLNRELLGPLYVILENELKAKVAEKKKMDESLR